MQTLFSLPYTVSLLLWLPQKLHASCSEKVMCFIPTRINNPNYLKLIQNKWINREIEIFVLRAATFLWCTKKAKKYLIPTNFGADLIFRIGHPFILHALIFAQRSKTDFRAYLFPRTATFPNLSRPKYLKSIGFNWSFINSLRF